MTPILLFAHGAGAGHDHPWMQRWRLRLGDVGDVHLLTYPYMSEGRKLPSPLPDLETVHLQSVLQLADRFPQRPLFLIGKSMGARVSVRIANRVPVAGVVAFGYPLVSSGRKRAVRDGPLRDVRRPTLLIQGTRDPMGPIDFLMDLVADHPTAQLQMRMVEDGDHSLQCRKLPLRRQGLNQDDVDDEILFDIQRFVASLLEQPTG